MIDSLLIVLPGLIWGASFLFIAEGLDAVSPSGVAFIRILVGFLTLSVVPAVRRPVHRADRARIAVLGVIWMAFPLSMFPFAEQHVSSALAGMLNGAVPLFVAAVAGGIARRAPARPILIGLAVGFLGAIPDRAAGHDAVRRPERADDRRAADPGGAGLVRLRLQPVRPAAAAQRRAAGDLARARRRRDPDRAARRAGRARGRTGRCGRPRRSSRSARAAPGSPT